MKSLTIEELKALPINDWVWIIDKRCGSSRYYQTYKKSEYVLQVFGEVYSTFQYDDYGTAWLAYKNKEQAEAKGEIVELPCLRQLTIQYKEKTTHPLELAYVGQYGQIQTELFSEDDPEAKRRLARLRGEDR